MSATMVKPYTNVTHGRKCGMENEQSTEHKTKSKIERIQTVVELTVKDVANIIHINYGLAYDEALKCFKTTSTYKQLITTDTGMWGESSLYIFEQFKAEMNKRNS